MAEKDGRLGILVGGGPAPGINSAISAATIEAVNSGLEVIGLYDGYRWLMEGRSQTRPLAIADVSFIHSRGGSILRTSRANPTGSPEKLENIVRALRDIGVSYLITIGGDDTAFSAREVAKTAGGALRVAHIPKTIDNDLPLPGGMPTFGYETARQLGTELVLNLVEDARTTSRWVFVVVMGRKAGHLALGIGKSAGATLTVIPEEFPEGVVKMADVCDIIEGTMLKRRAMDQQHGLVVIAEGIGERMDAEELKKMAGAVAYDEHGHIRLGEIPISMVIRREIQRRFAQRGEKLTIADVTLGYELRCARPIPFDIDYTRTLGHGAIRFLLSEVQDERLRYGGLVCLDSGRLRVLGFDEIRDPVTGRTHARLVDVNSEYYEVAREYMIRLEPADLLDSEKLAKLAEVAKTTPQEFRYTFAHAAGLSDREAQRSMRAAT